MGWGRSIGTAATCQAYVNNIRGDLVKFTRLVYRVQISNLIGLLFLVHNHAMIEPIDQSAMLFTESTIYEK
jgi:hypothetical protein